MNIFFRKKIAQEINHFIVKKVYSLFWISFFWKKKRKRKNRSIWKFSEYYQHKGILWKNISKIKEKKLGVSFTKRTKLRLEEPGNCCEESLGGKEWRNKIQENLWMVMTWANNITPYKILIICFTISCNPAKCTAASSAMWATHTQENKQTKPPYPGKHPPINMPLDYDWWATQILCPKMVHAVEELWVVLFDPHLSKDNERI